MALQMSTAVRNARLNAIISTIGASPVLKLFSGAVPAGCATADPSGLLMTMSLPSAWENAASGGTTTLEGAWTGTASAAGTADCYRIYDSSGNCHLQGTVTVTGSGGDITLDNPVLNSGQTVNQASYTLTEGNA